ncbi:hypothetical protein HPP92_021954 [Vanilla planifolia]|uniref:Uncharacterized protein n=1 Tax=Vanilla planifolia TaxID=51239 RepID=A0A835PRB9_VANPL|nr:hypothetical protein HPP92_021954 [Vanilla planifolia]
MTCRRKIEASDARIAFLTQKSGISHQTDPSILKVNPLDVYGTTNAIEHD